MQDLKGKTLFITGGASGIGYGITKVLVDAGMNAVIGDIRQDHINEALDFFEKKQQGRQVHAIKLDITDRDAMKAAADETERKFGKVHVLINNAGVDPSGPLKEATYVDWDYAMGVNLGGVINGVQTFLPRILKHKEGGHIVSTASLAGLVTMPAQMAMYATAKAAVIAFMESIRGELAADNIGVSVLCPGPIKSRIHESGQNRPERFRQGSGFKASEEQLSKRQVSDLWMEPTEVGEMVKRAILNNELYIITHGEWKDAVKSRFEGIMAAMPKSQNIDYSASFADSAAKVPETRK
jgi:NAD(P)-dependent dehydrogenase (short-subunit alcohol dehydrogenase family)